MKILVDGVLSVNPDGQILLSATLKIDGEKVWEQETVVSSAKSKDLAEEILRNQGVTHARQGILEG